LIIDSQKMRIPIEAPHKVVVLLPPVVLIYNKTKHSFKQIFICSLDRDDKRMLDLEKQLDKLVLDREKEESTRRIVCSIRKSYIS